MTAMKRIFIILLLVALAVCACACSQYVDMDSEDTGIAVDRDGLEDAKETANSQKVIYEDGIDQAQPVFYWTENGSVFHGTAECSSLSNSSVVICGNLTHALEYGVVRSCSRCFDKT